MKGKARGLRRKIRKQLLVALQEEERILTIERGSSRSHSVENVVWKRLQDNTTK
jgi:hypothetical protein